MPRYNLDLGEDVYAELQRLAEAEQRPIAELVRRFIRLGLLVQRADSVILRENGHEREIILL